MSEIFSMFAYIGRRTLVLLATPKAIFDAIDTLTDYQIDYA